MALSSATNPTVDGFRKAAIDMVAASTLTGSNSIPVPCQSVQVNSITTNEQDILVLPSLADVPNGHEIVICNNAGSDFQLRTPASSNEKINNIDCDGTNEYAMTNGQILRVVKRSNTAGWVAYGLTNLGASATAVVPEGHSLSPSLSPSKSPSLSPSLSPSVSPSASRSPSVSPSVSLSPSVSPSVSLSPSLSPSVSPSASVSRSASVSPSVSLSPSVSPSVSTSPSVSASPSPSPSP